MNRRALLTVLLEADPRAPELYSTSPEFRAVMDGLVNVAPALVRTAADEAVDANIRRADLIREAMTRPPAPMRLTDWPDLTNWPDKP